MSERRNKIVQWMLNQGRGIVDAPETCFLKETTEKEQAEHPFGSVRYVYSMVVNLFENEIPFPEQVDYAVETDMDMLDFDEWQGIQEILFGEDSDRASRNVQEQSIQRCGSITIFPRMRFWNAMTGFLRNWTKQEEKPFRPLRKTWKHLH